MMPNPPSTHYFRETSYIPINDWYGVQDASTERAFRLLDFPFSDSSITVAEYGCSIGRNVKLIKKFLALHDSFDTVQLVLNDLPTNDWYHLSSVVDKARPEMVNKHNERLEIFPMMVPKPFSQQIVPSSSVDVGLAVHTLHALTRPGLPLPQISRELMQLRPKEWKEAAREELLAFLNARHRELITGGNLILCMTTNGRINYESCIEAIYKTWQVLIDAGKVSPCALQHFSIPVYLRTFDEVMDCIKSTSGRWEIAQSFAETIPHPVVECWRQKALKSSQENGTPDQTMQDNYTQAIANELFDVMKIEAMGIHHLLRDKGFQTFPSDESFEQTFKSTLKECLKPSTANMDVRIGFDYIYFRMRKL